MRFILKISKILAISISLFSFISIALITCAVVSFVSTAKPYNNDFCTLTDPVYQEIRLNGAQWTEHFDSLTIDSPSPEWYRRIIVPERGAYTVIGHYGARSVDDPSFYVSMRPGWPNNTEGSRGYLYIPSANPPSFYWTNRYKIQHLNGNVFCYHK